MYMYMCIRVSVSEVVAILYVYPSGLTLYIRPPEWVWIDRLRRLHERKSCNFNSTRIRIPCSRVACLFCILSASGCDGVCSFFKFSSLSCPECCSAGVLRVCASRPDSQKGNVMITSRSQHIGIIPSQTYQNNTLLEAWWHRPIVPDVVDGVIKKMHNSEEDL